MRAQFLTEQLYTVAQWEVCGNMLSNLSLLLSDSDAVLLLE